MNEEQPDNILLVPPDVDLQQLKDYAEGNGPVPDRSYLEPFAVWTTRGRVSDCDCQLLQCACAQARLHAKRCRFRIALTCAIPIACEAHGRDVCPHCDVCDCGAEK
jgi:hypothetical protein